MNQDEIIEMAKEAGYKHPDAVGICEDFAYFDLEAFAKLVEERTAAKERKHWKEIVEGQLRCITVLNDIVGGEGSTTTKNILDYSRMEERIQEAVAKEREACANTVETIETYEKIEKACFKFAAKTIRARGEA